MSEQLYQGYRTLGELQDEINALVEKYGRDQKYGLSAAYGAEGDLTGCVYSDNSPVIFLETDICTG